MSNFWEMCNIIIQGVYTNLYSICLKLPNPILDLILMAALLINRAISTVGSIRPSISTQASRSFTSFSNKLGGYKNRGFSYLITSPRTYSFVRSCGTSAPRMISAIESISKSEPVVSSDWLHMNFGNPDVKVLDASWYMPDEHRNQFQEYQVAHIPGALFFDVDGISDRKSDLPHMLPSEEAFSAAVSALGIDNKDVVVVYDGKGIFSAARVWWMFRAFGHGNIWVLDGGLPKWHAYGYEVESSASGDAVLKAGAANEAVEKFYRGQMVGPTTFEAKLQPHLLWSLEQIKQNILDQTYQLVDARSKARFDGLAPEPRKGIRGGHIPGSKCIPFGQVLDGSQMLLPSEELAKIFEQEGISLDRPIVASCGTGVTACILALGLHRLGKVDVPIYDGSWTEWGTLPDTPLESSA